MRKCGACLRPYRAPGARALVLGSQPDVHGRVRRTEFALVCPSCARTGLLVVAVPHDAGEARRVSADSSAAPAAPACAYCGDEREGPWSQVRFARDADAFGARIPAGAVRLVCEECESVLRGAGYLSARPSPSPSPSP